MPAGKSQGRLRDETKESLAWEAAGKTHTGFFHALHTAYSVDSCIASNLQKTSNFQVLYRFQRWMLRTAFP